MIINADNAGAIAGAVIGVLLFLAIIVGVVVAVGYLVWRSRSPKYIARRYAHTCTWMHSDLHVHVYAVSFVVTYVYIHLYIHVGIYPEQSLQVHHREMQIQRSQSHMCMSRQALHLSLLSRKAGNGNL